MTASATESLRESRGNRATWFSVTARLRKISTWAYAAQVLSDASLVLKIVTGATFVIVSILTLLLLISVAVGNEYVLPRFISAVIVLVYVIAIIRLVRIRRPRVATLLILLLYMGIGTAMMFIWGPNLPMVTLVFGSVIILSGILLGARWIIPTTFAVIGLLMSVQVLDTVGISRPDVSVLSQQPNFIDVTGYSAVFIFIAVVSWLAGRRTEQSLAKALQAEADLQVEKDMLAVRLEERERSLREAQLEEMRQLYHFAELGQLGTVVLHDLANNLTALTLDIDDIEKQHRRSAAVGRARESITYLDDMVAAARRQLRRNDKPIVFNAFEQIDETVGNLRPKALRAGVTVRVITHPRRSTFTVIGDPLRFAQVVTILVTNAIEAYAGVPGDGHTVTVTLDLYQSSLQIAVSDEGHGIDAQGRKLLFKPFHSTKQNGMGIGLFITHEIVERHFKGSITLNKSRTQTRFVVRIPEYHGS